MEGPDVGVVQDEGEGTEEEGVEAVDGLVEEVVEGEGGRKGRRRRSRRVGGGLGGGHGRGGLCLFVPVCVCVYVEVYVSMWSRWIVCVWLCLINE